MRFRDARHAPAHSLPCALRDYPEWHRGRPRYAVWCLPVACPRILARCAAARAHLGDWLQPDYRRQAHVTLFVCGFPAAQARFDDDFPAARLAAQLAALRRLRARPLRLRVGGLDSYASAPFLAVEDPEDALDPLRAALAAQGAEVRQAPYQAHLTVGLYARRLPGEAVRRRLAAFADAAPLELAVDELQLCSYASRELFGPLRCEQRLPLHG